MVARNLRPGKGTSASATDTSHPSFCGLRLTARNAKGRVAKIPERRVTSKPAVFSSSRYSPRGVARMALDRRGAGELSREEKADSGVEVRQVGNAQQEATSGFKDPCDLAQRSRLIQE
jgi:hypothetical protein